MKTRDYFILPLIAGAFTMTSCEKKSEEPTSTEAPEAAPLERDSVVAEPPVDTEIVEKADEVKESAQEAADKVVEEVKEAVKPLVQGSLEDLSKEAGFAKFVPQGSSFYMGFYDGAKLVKGIRDSKFGQLLEMMAEEEGESLDEIAEDPSFQQFATIAGEEIFVAVGEDGPEQAANLMALNDKVAYHQMKFYVKMVEGMIASPDGAVDPEILMEDLYLFDLMKDEKAAEVFAKSNMPAVYLGFKVSDEDKRTLLLEQIQSVGDMILGEQDVALFEANESAAGNGFKGVTLKGKLLAEQMEGEIEDMLKAQIGPDMYAKYKEMIAAKQFAMMAGSVDEYIVLFFGSSPEQLKLAEKPSDSILAGDDMAFAKYFADKDVIGLLYSSEKMQKASLEGASTLAPMAMGLKEGLEKSESFGDTRVVAALLDDLAKCEKSLYSLDSGSRLGLVAYLEEGLKVEMYGGSDAPAQDFTTSRALASMTQGDDILFSANWVSNPEYVEKLMEYTDAFGSTAYQLAKQASELDIEDADFKEFNAQFRMVDSSFKEELLGIWKALRVDLAGGLGAESAIVVDINGKLPTVPKIPNYIVKNGSIPRISYVSTASDREKLGQSWEQINKSAESILAKVSEMAGEEIPMQLPMKSTNEGLTSWTFAIPGTHPNCSPTAVVSDELFFLSTSPDFTGELAKNFDKSKSAAPGASMTLDLEVLSVWAKRWYDLVDQHGSEFLSETEMVEFNTEVKPRAQKIFEAMDQLDYLKIETRKEDGELRSSMHFKVK